MVTYPIALYDVVEMKKAHPCLHRTRLFQVVRLGADLKIRCLGCGNIIMIDRDAFNQAVRKIVSHQKGLIPLQGPK